MVRTFLWDLDGTIIDSGPSIIASIRAALAQCGLPDVPAEQARGCVGPPLIEGLPRFCAVPLDRLDEVIAAYREIYATRMLTAPLYPGVLETIDAARERGITNALATAKPEVTAREILAAKGLTDRFTVIAGADPERGINHKEQVVALCLARLGEAGVTAPALMIGDRQYDMDGARSNDIEAAFVSWGYGSEGEAGGFPVISSPDQLLAAPYHAPHSERP